MALGASMVIRDVVRQMVESGVYTIARNSWLTGKNAEFLSAMGRAAKTDVVLKKVPPWSKARNGPAAAPTAIQLQWYKMAKAQAEARAQNLTGNARRNFVATRLAGKIPDAYKRKKVERAAETIKVLEQRLKARNVDPEAVLAAGAQAAAAQAAASAEIRTPPARSGSRPKLA